MMPFSPKMQCLGLFVAGLQLLLLAPTGSLAFSSSPHHAAIRPRTTSSASSSFLRDPKTTSTLQSTTSTRLFLYVPPEQSGGGSSSATATPVKPPLYPKAGDFVRYYDLDGGKEDGQVLVGRIRFIQKQLESSSPSGWSVELTEMEDVGEGYYAEYASRKRFMKGTVYRDLLAVSPLTASFVRSEDAYKVPTKQADGSLILKAEKYDVEGYMGPFTTEDGQSTIDEAVLEADSALYEALKGKLYRYTGIVGAVAALVCDLTRGTEQAIIYVAGLISSLAYLFFLSLKTDTIATSDSEFKKNLSALRFVTPIIVLACVALYNQSLGDANPARSENIFSTVTAQQYAAAMVGFLTYRLPLLLIQIQDAFKDEADENLLPTGSAGVALKLMQQDTADEGSSPGGLTVDSTTTVFLISGPQATGRPELVKRLLNEEKEGYNVQFTTPTMVDRVKEGATFERYMQRDEFLSVDPTERYGLTQQAILDAAEAASDAAEKDGSKAPIVVLDADVELAKKLARISNLRLVGVWVGLGSVAEFEKRVEAMIDNGQLPIEEDETKQSTVRSKIREIVKEIEFGISSGIFEFTILNDDQSNTDKSLLQLREAAKYVNVD